MWFIIEGWKTGVYPPLSRNHLLVHWILGCWLVHTSKVMTHWSQNQITWSIFTTIYSPSMDSKKSFYPSSLLSVKAWRHVCVYLPDTNSCWGSEAVCWEGPDEAGLVGTVTQQFYCSRRPYYMSDWNQTSYCWKSQYLWSQHHQISCQKITS